MVHRIGKKVPDTEKSSFIAWNAEVAGDVTLGNDVSVWFGASVRADIAPISIGDGSNIQDNCSVHVDTDVPVVIGKNVTVGHNAVVHGCRIGDGSLVGIGAIILSGAVIGKECLIGAGTLVTEGKTFGDRTLILGSPAKAVRPLSDIDLERMRKNTEHYIGLGREASRHYGEIPAATGGNPPEERQPR